MGADFTFQLIPCCKLTPERLAVAKEIITKTDEDILDAEGKDSALGVLDSYANCEYKDRRDVSHLCLNDVTYYITGGMSWGDDPTDAYGDFRVIQECFEQLEAWCKEDKNIEATPRISRKEVGKEDCLQCGGSGREHETVEDDTPCHHCGGTTHEPVVILTATSPNAVHSRTINKP